MNITLLTYGSRGDFQPFLALAVALQKSSYNVRLAGPGCFAQYAAAYNVPFVPLAGDPIELSKSFNDAGKNVFRMVRSMQKHVFSIAPQVVRQSHLALQGADMLIHSFLFTAGGHTFSREMHIPDISMQIFPIFAPTRAFPNPAFGNIPPGLFSYFTHWLAEKVFWFGGMGGYMRLRRHVDQDFPRRLYWPFTQSGDRPLTPLVFAYSPSVLPRPVEWSDDHIHIPGYLFLDEATYTPPPELERFLGDGEPPICFSFGSMVHREADRIGKVILGVLERTGQRGVILTGWGGWKPAGVPANVLYLEAAPHGWLFPRCRVIIHHGGAGTTAASLRAGKPNIVIPFAADQPFWGKRVAMLGAGPQPLSVNRLTVESLSKILAETLSSESMKSRALELGRKIQNENAVGEILSMVDQITRRTMKDKY